MKTLKLLLALGFVAGLIIEPVMAAASRPNRVHLPDADDKAAQEIIARNLTQAGKHDSDHNCMIYAEEGCHLPYSGAPEKRRLCEHSHPRIYAVRLGEGYEQKNQYVPAFVSVFELVDGQAAVATGPAGGAGAQVEAALPDTSPEERTGQNFFGGDGEDVDVETAAHFSSLAIIPYGSPMYQRVPVVEALAMVPYGVDPVAYVQAAGQLSRQEAEVERRMLAAEAFGVPLDE